MVAKTFDPKCYDLASAFLEDEPCTGARQCEDLALHIQQAIEDWLAHYRDNFEPPDPPGFEGGFAANH